MVKEFEQRGEAILRRLGSNAKAVEVGVFLGSLSEYLLRRNPDLHLMMVDNWLPTELQPQAYRDTGDEHAHANASRLACQRATALSRAQAFGLRSTVMEMASVDAAACTPDGSLDLVFLDADHSYDGVKADLAAWVPKVKRGGWIGGHDYQNRSPVYDFSGVDRAVDEWAAMRGVGVETDLNFTWFARI